MIKNAENQHCGIFHNMITFKKNIEGVIMNNTIEVRCILSDSQLERLKTATEIIRNDTGNEQWDEQMALQLAIGNTHMTETILIMLESYIEKNINGK